MRIPKEVKVGAYTYKVRRLKKVSKEGKECWGLCDHKKFTISLQKDLTGIDLKVTFIHECLHAIEYAYEITLGEKKINKLDNYLVAFFLDNNVNFNE
jgi:hypothetical protein